ncbi:lipocalin family protein [Aquimarina sp. SS2-1]|uniref:lipocalin family protein n=1 Tax=Aquimarina besae TaxID=3342247 RepID=UPI00366E2D26
MKKILLLFVATISFCITSCGDDDDDGTVQDPLVGSWQLSQEFENGVEIASDPCDLEGVLTFRINGTYEGTFFEDDGTGVCVQLVEETETGTWRKTGNNIYTFIVEGDTITDEITFSGNTFSIEYSDTFGDQTTEYRDVYIKI